jgi:hypothetical protein
MQIERLDQVFAMIDETPRGKNWQLKKLRIADLRSYQY